MLIAGCVSITMACKKGEVTEETPEQKLVRLEKLNPDKLEIPDRTNAITAVYQDLTIAVTGTIDLREAKTNLNYKFSNVGNISRKLTLVNPVVPDQDMQLSLAQKEKTETQFKGDVVISRLSDKTSFVRIRPYLLEKKKADDNRLVLGTYDAKLEIVLPENARIIKSNIPLQTEMGKTYFVANKASVLPSVEIWYTLAEENIEITKELIKGDTTMVNIKIKNYTLRNVKDLTLSGQIPATLCRVLEEISDGSFILQNGAMYEWKYKFKQINRGSTKVLKIMLIDESQSLSVDNIKIAVHNSTGDLIQVE